VFPFEGGGSLRPDQLSRLSEKGGKTTGKRRIERKERAHSTERSVI